MTNTDHYFKVFKIKKISDISKSELKRRYRILVKKYHPDHGGNAVHFRLIQESYEYLKNLVSQQERIDNKKFFNSKLRFYANGSVFDTQKNRWVKVKGRKINVKA